MNSGAIHPGTVGAEMDHPNVWITAPVLSSLSGDEGRARAGTHEPCRLRPPATLPVAGEVLSMYTTSLADGSVIRPSGYR